MTSGDSDTDHMVRGLCCYVQACQQVAQPAKRHRIYLPSNSNLPASLHQTYQPAQNLLTRTCLPVYLPICLPAIEFKPASQSATPKPAYTESNQPASLKQLPVCTEAASQSITEPACIEFTSLTPNLPANEPEPTCQRHRTCLPASLCLPACLPACLPTYPRTCQPIYQLAYERTNHEDT
jgi:hypothetical protein